MANRIKTNHFPFYTCHQECFMNTWGGDSQTCREQRWMTWCFTAVTTHWVKTQTFSHLSEPLLNMWHKAHPCCLTPSTSACRSMLSGEAGGCQQSGDSRPVWLHLSDDKFIKLIITSGFKKYRASKLSTRCLDSLKTKFASSDLANVAETMWVSWTGLTRRLRRPCGLCLNIMK